MAKSNAKRNKAAGHEYERKHVQLFKERLGFKDVTTSRNTNLSRDREGIDLSNSDESVHGRLFIDVQCKKVTSREINLPKALENMKPDPGRLRVVFWEQTYRCMDPGIHYDCMKTKGEYAFCSIEDFYKLLEAYLKVHGIGRNVAGATEFERCRTILSELVALKVIKETLGETDEYKQRQPIAWQQAKEFFNLKPKDDAEATTK